MTRAFFSSLRVRLWLLVSLTILPALVLILYTAAAQRRHAAAEMGHHALRLARLAAIHHAQLLEDVRALLMKLAHLPHLSPDDPAACQRLLQDTLQQHPRYANLGIASPTGDVLCSAAPFLAPRSTADRSWFQQIVQTGNFMVGAPQIGGMTDKSVLAFGYPVVTNPKHVRVVAFATLELTWFSQFATKARLPEHSTFTVMDQHGLILVRYPDPETWLGLSALGTTMAETILTHGEGMAEATGLDGLPHLLGFTRLDSMHNMAELYVCVSVPSYVAFAEANRMRWLNLLGLGLIAVFAMVVARVGGDAFIFRRVQTLVWTTQRLSAGDLQARTGLPHGPDELSQLAKAFDEMAASLERYQMQRLREEQLRQAHAALEEETHRVEEMSRMKSEFVSLVAHELRTPLTSVMGYVSLLVDGEGGRLTDEQLEFLHIVQSSADRLANLINDLLDLSRIEAGRLELKQSVVDIVPILQDVTKAIRLQIEAKKQDLTLDLVGPLPAILGDPERLAQIVTNFLTNAHKYTPPGGNITVRAWAEARYVCINVQDTGIGLAPDDQAQLFTRFFRAQNRATQEAGGVGLGLVIARSLVELHGGKISVTSTPGVGSTFSFTVPIAPTTAAVASGD